MKSTVNDLDSKDQNTFFSDSDLTALEDQITEIFES